MVVLVDQWHLEVKGTGKDTNSCYLNRCPERSRSAIIWARFFVFPFPFLLIYLCGGGYQDCHIKGMADK